ncbi:cytochrome P450 [Kribbella solani]|uniref:cytochrome P450 n=1 Tax=Kribbella solani TaxID=236067 RepID=UPI0029A8B1A5|nr:cytochrome P450 [Kribbella solani]MDX2973449.1 cytochrome P450 [Kribbella solani]MDX3002710.1 cytochrome P450 [Kribbella solani]
MSVPVYPMTRATGCPFDPPPQLRDLQGEAPLVKVQVLGRTAWMVTRYADQRKLLADPRLSSDVGKPGYPNSVARPVQSDEDTGIGFILMDDPEHSRLRRMVTAPFMIKRVEAMRPQVQEIVDNLIDDMLAGPKPVDLVTAFALPVPSLVICRLLGVPYEDHDFFQQNSKTLIRTSASIEERTEARNNIGRYLNELMGAKLANPEDDLLSGLAERVKAGELTRRDAAGIGVLLLIAGHETTANMIALGTLALLEHPDQLAVLRESEDPKLVAGAVEELLRYLNITHNGRRRAVLEDIEFAGEVLKAGDGVIFPNDLGNRDADAFPDPDRLDVSRDARHHIAFGFGVHQCLGQPLARMELQVVYGTLYRRIPALRRAVGLDEIPFKHDGAVYGVYSLPVTW